MRKDESGSIVVETIGAFIPFVLLVASILSLVNIVTVQTRVHYALTQAATTLSMYSYALEVTGVAGVLTTLDNKGSKARKEVNALKNDMQAVFDSMGSLSSGEKAYSTGRSIADDPIGTLRTIVTYGANEGRNALFAQLARPLVGKYLTNGQLSGDQYLRRAHVINGLEGLEFYNASKGANNSILIDKDGNIKLVVRYEIEYKFGALPLPLQPKLAITQTVKTKAWLNGSGKGYW